MRKTVYIALVLILTMLFPVSSMALETDVKVSSKVGYTTAKFDTDKDKECVFDITMLYPYVSKFEGKSENTFFIDCPDDIDADIFLRVHTESNINTDKIIDFYDFVITDTDGKGIFDKSNENNVITGNKSKDIPLGSFKGKNDKKAYILTCDKSDNADTSTDLSHLSLSFVLKNNKDISSVNVGNDSGSDQKFDLNEVIQNNGGFVFGDDEEVTPASTPDPLKSDKLIKKVCGKDIPAGRYIVSGNGWLNVTSAAGADKGSANITDGTNTKVQGIKSVAVVLETGDVINILPLEGDEKARLKFDKAAATENGTDRTPTITKSNPKTNDSSSGALLYGGIALVLLIGLTAVKRFKKKQDN